MTSWKVGPAFIDDGISFRRSHRDLEMCGKLFEASYIALEMLIVVGKWPNKDD